MKYTQGEYRLIRKDNLGQDLYRFVLECPEITAVAAPGQFVHILPKGSTLRRPISICQIDRQAGTLTLVFAVRGEGTAVLADLRAGDYVDMLAPLGHGFTIQPDANRVILMGGGIGVPPMLALAEIYGERATVISGFRSMPAVMLQEEFAKTGAKTILCTDDGTAGLHAMVTEPGHDLCLWPYPHASCHCKDRRGAGYFLRGFHGRTYGLWHRRMPGMRMQNEAGKRRDPCSPCVQGRPGIQCKGGGLEWLICL